MNEAEFMIGNSSSGIIERRASGAMLHRVPDAMQREAMSLRAGTRASGGEVPFSSERRSSATMATYRNCSSRGSLRHMNT